MNFLVKFSATEYISVFISLELRISVSYEDITTPLL
jgi:hypothetical protein